MVPNEEPETLPVCVYGHLHFQSEAEAHTIFAILPSIMMKPPFIAGIPLISFLVDAVP